MRILSKDRNRWRSQVTALAEQVLKEQEVATDLMAKLAATQKELGIARRRITHWTTKAREQKHALGSAQQAAAIHAAQGIRQVEAEEAVAEAEAAAAAAAEDAAAARDELIQVNQDRMQLQATADGSSTALLLLQRKMSRLQEKAASRLAAPPISRTADEWCALQRSARLMAQKRERDYLFNLFSSRPFRMCDLAAVVESLELTKELFETKSIFTMYVNRTNALMKQLEMEEFGIEFGLFLRFEMHIPLPKLVRLTQAASKKFVRRETDAGEPNAALGSHHVPKCLLSNPFLKGHCVSVPRIAPPRSKLEPAIREMETQLGVQAAENGRIAFRSISEVFNQLLIEDPGVVGAMPNLSYFLGGRAKLPIVISRDATGKGKVKLTTACINNPWASKSAQFIRVIGLGNVDDGHDGSKRLFGETNLQTIETLVAADEADECVSTEVGEICPMVLFADDVSCLRHGERLANSGWCGCSRDFALRVVPKRPGTVKEMYTELDKCKAPTKVERLILSHSKVNGKVVPCTGCTFGHNPATAEAEFDAESAVIAELAKDVSKKGKDKSRK